MQLTLGILVSLEFRYSEYNRAFEMGMAAARLLIRQIEEEEDIIQSEIVTIKTELIIRESSMKTSL
ncbi:hypothetical protein MM239_19300 [Belliella sp. DSM 111904]|uniref:LacI family transcriptional regulator n=1 Tax=Belliella filtrata TaxID=2923435 RepID=A0ABS9V566_9BACT|nr:hypothetical protein [Belliella filtrata]MCH7411543.1 hypothetical protein [Belliella filtrata]